MGGEEGYRRGDNNVLKNNPFSKKMSGGCMLTLDSTLTASTVPPYRYSGFHSSLSFAGTPFFAFGRFKIYCVKCQSVKRLSLESESPSNLLVLSSAVWKRSYSFRCHPKIVCLNSNTVSERKLFRCPMPLTDLSPSFVPFVQPNLSGAASTNLGSTFTFPDPRL